MKKGFIIIAVVLSFLLYGSAWAADEAAIQELQTDVSVTKTKADKNTAEIESMKGGLPAERAGREAADADLQNQINTIELTPGPQGEQGLQGAPGPAGPPGPEGLARSPGIAVNPSQVAILRWYPFNISGIAFQTGTNPKALAFDGANIWVANSGDTTVTKLRASDGTLLGTFNTGAAPVALVFDGTNIWVANHDNSTVTKLRASDGTLLGTFNTGAAPVALVFDGANIWVANHDNSTVTKY